VEKVTNGRIADDSAGPVKNGEFENGTHKILY
jgi:hypothetical protein